MTGGPRWLGRFEGVEMTRGSHVRGRPVDFIYIVIKGFGF